MEKEAKTKKVEHVEETQVVAEEPVEPTYTIFDVMNTIEEHPDGSVTLPLLLVDEKPRKFESKQKYEEWVNEKKQLLIEKAKSKLSPHEFYLTQGKHMERPFTGNYWWLKDVGTYSCKVCDQKLFLTEHKYMANNGYPNFWNHIIDAVTYREDHLENYKVNSNNAYIEPNFRENLPEIRAVCSN